MSKHISYWLQGESIQNFGDYLTEFFLNRLFHDQISHEANIRIIGSCIDDGLIAAGLDREGKQCQTIFWGCGLRHEAGLSERARAHVEILAVRGPLSRSALRLGAAVPIGDPGLLLPALHRPQGIGSLAGSKILVPHFLDLRSDDELLAMSRCDLVVRPNIRSTPEALTGFIDAITSADFVLCGALHAAITMAAYGGRFAFWDSGSVDLPFKWRDFAASVGIPCLFAKTVDDAEASYDRDIRPHLRIPPLTPLVAVAPFPVRADAMAAIIEGDLARHEAGALEYNILTSGARQLAHRLASQKAGQAVAFERLANERDLLRAQVADISAAMTATAGECSQLRAQLAATSVEAKATANERDALHRIAEDAEHAAETRATTLMTERDEARSEARAAIARQLHAESALNLVWSSTSWRVLGPLRRAGRRAPRAARLVRRSLKLAWWTVTLQLGQRLIAWRRHQAETTAQIAQTALPDAGATESTAGRTASSGSPAGLANPLPRGPDLKAAFEALYGTEAIYFPPVQEPEVSIIIPVYRGLDDILTCLRSLSVHRASEPSFEVIVVDDSPDAPVLWALPRSGGLTGIQNTENLGFLRSCNLGATKARGRVLCFLNSDTIVSRNWLTSLVEALEEPRAALSGSMLLNRDGTIQDAGWRIMANGWGHPLGRGADARDGAHTHRRLVDCVTGACFCIMRDLWEELQGFDSTYAPAFYEEFDLAFRASRKGMTIVYEPRSRIIHLGSASYGAERRDQLSRINHATFSQRFADFLRKQPHDASDEFPLRRAGPEQPTILVIDDRTPIPEQHAGDVTMASYLHLLARSGWRVVFGPHDNQASGPFCEKLEACGVEMIRAPQTIASWLATHGKHVSRVWVGRPAIAAEHLPAIRSATDAPIAYYTHDLHHLRMMREAALREDKSLAEAARATQAQEVGILQSVDHVMSPSGEECDKIRQLLPDVKVSKLAPYFYESEQIRTRSITDFQGLRDVLFVGGFPHTPNVDAALYLVHEVMPLVWKSRPDARLLLVGYAPPPEVRALASERVIVTGQAPDLAPWFDRSRVMLAALRYGAGVKGKVVEALRNGLPVVTTPIGAEGIGLAHRHDAIIADTAAGLAEGVISLLNDAETCARMSAAGAATVAREFSVKSARATIESIFGAPRCAACGSLRLIRTSDQRNIRESFACGDCFALARCEALAQVILMRYARHGETSLLELFPHVPDLRVHELGFVGGIAESLNGFPNYSMSEYFPGVALGEMGPGGVRCEDVTALTFADSSFDIVISQDVMEHVPDPLSGFTEIARVLKPGGSHFFTIPQDRGAEHSVTRALRGPNGIEHILPPAYHGDPVRPEGALVFTDYGRDLPELIAQAGLILTEHELRGLYGSRDATLYVFEAIKPAIQRNPDV